jgi:hypothetical protein
MAQRTSTQSDYTCRNTRDPIPTAALGVEFAMMRISGFIAEAVVLPIRLVPIAIRQSNLVPARSQHPYRQTEISFGILSGKAIDKSADARDRLGAAQLMCEMTRQE